MYIVNDQSFSTFSDAIDYCMSVPGSEVKSEEVIVLVKQIIEDEDVEIAQIMYQAQKRLLKGLN